jgi:MoaA/NifB/PqqE/SkfB family radical SAM enzyme
MGEPFTHKGIYALIEDVKRRGLHLTIITNLVAADVDRVVALGVDSLLVGVQGASEPSYLAFHPNFLPSHWAQLNEQLGRLAGAAGIDVKQVQVICRHNAHELSAMVELGARTNAARVNFKLASLKGGTEHVRITPAQRARLLDHDVDAAVVRAQALGVATNLDVLGAQLRAGADDVDEYATAPIADVGCFVGAFYARVTVDGTVLFCCNTDVVVGSLATLPFSSVSVMLLPDILACSTQPPTVFTGWVPLSSAIILAIAGDIASAATTWQVVPASELGNPSCPFSQPPHTRALPA